MEKEAAHFEQHANISLLFSSETVLFLKKNSSTIMPLPRDF